MIPVDKKLILRVAARMEQLAKERYDAALKGNPDRVDEARRTRDRELGDVLDLRTYIEREEATARDAARYDFLRAASADLDINNLLRDGGPEMDERVDAAMAKARGA